MSNPEENDIDKIFNELMSSNSIEDIEQPKDRDYIIQEMLHVQESLAESLLSINSIIYYLVKDVEYNIPDSISSLIDPLFKVSETFISHLLDLSGTIEAENFESEDENEDGE
jgi:hypothetical protein